MPTPEARNAVMLSERSHTEEGTPEAPRRFRSKRPATRLVSALAFTLGMSLGIPYAVAQAQAPVAPQAQDQGAHHPGTDEGAQSGIATSAPPGNGQGLGGPGGMPMMAGMGQGEMMGPGGMMGQNGPSGAGDISQMMGEMSRMMGDMGRMMGTMQHMMPVTGGMTRERGGMGMPFAHVEGRLAFLKAELKITPAQEPQWSTFADACRTVAHTVRERLGETRPQRMQGDGTRTSTLPERIDRYEQMLTMRLDAVRTVKAAFDPLYASLSDSQRKTFEQLFSGWMRLR